MATRSNRPKASPRPLVSVVIPAYNTRATIAETIDSVLAQTYKQYEIIVVDDDSPDDVADFVAKRYGAKITLIRQANAGLAGARNTGIRQAAGDYVAFLDSDDVWLPQKLEAQVAQAEQNPEAGVFYGDCYFWEGGQRTGRWTDLHGQKDGLIAPELINRRVMIPVVTALVKRTALQAANGFNESLRRVEDYDLWLRLAVAGQRFVSTKEPLALYRLNPAGLSSNTLAQAQTQLAVYRSLLANPAAHLLTPAITEQIRLFRLEVLHQQRKASLQQGRRFGAALATIKMAPSEPRRTPKILAAAGWILLAPRSALTTRFQ